PSLLALSDTLKFFNVNNGAFKIEKAEIDLLPNSFVARLKKGNIDFLSFVERNENAFIYTNGTEQKHSVLRHDFESLWDNVVLLVEQEGKEAVKLKSKKGLLQSLLMITVMLFLMVEVINFSNKWFALFYVFPTLGVFMSVAALKDLFKTKN